MKYFLILILYFSITNQALGDSIFCQFEEVYSNGDVQTGQILLKDDSLRYEYFRDDLFSVLYVNKKIFTINNLDRNKVQLIENSNTIIPEFMKIYLDFPNLKTYYKRNGYEIFVEHSKNKFIKRFVISSDKLNLSIYFLGCEDVDLPKNLFNFNPFIEYVRN